MEATVLFRLNRLIEEERLRWTGKAVDAVRAEPLTAEEVLASTGYEGRPSVVRYYVHVRGAPEGRFGPYNNVAVCYVGGDMCGFQFPF